MDNKEICEKLKYGGCLYDSIERLENFFADNLGLLWKFYAFKKLIVFKGYSLAQKIRIIFSEKDPDNKFFEHLHSKKYELLENYYNKEIRDFFPFVLSDRNDYSLRLRKFFACCREIFYLDVYRVSSLISDNDRVIDIGGNIGLFSFYIKNLFPESDIIVFEPEQNNFEILQRNLSLYSRITLLKQAVGQNNGTGELNVSNNPLAHFINDIEIDLDVRPGIIGSQDVNIVALDSVIKDKIDVIKVDIEGYEGKALSGAKNIINKYLPLLLVSVEHSKKQKDNVINAMQSICPDYKFINLNEDVICFYMLPKHQERIDKIKLIR